MRVVLISDTHGYLDDRIAAFLPGCDRIVHAGDVGAGVAEALAALELPVTVVTGNNDPADAGWPVSAELDLPGGRLVVIHGHQWPAARRHRRLRAAYPDARAVVCGHSHRQVVDRDQAPWILNPGAAGRTRTYGGPGYIVLDADSQGWRVDARQLSRRP
ncbi:metallophosphoesterase family protein [Spectribacter hydrogenoxidans]|uniref:Phosphoesterase n=1 Tax=Spectribacter hydrogenoxidans TaxID=3075608 RepID=A0ABU3BWM0_9GAMM|nr:metallophosphoesterase family protein [Salinisphaera sp. W335]MDT0633692.1 metallophosphoesterase family protein [Salinisphaera sp. W335]